MIDDSYNANPDSVKAAVEVLNEMNSPRILVLGDMGEVGSQGQAFHAEIGQFARERGVDAVYSLGDLSRASAEAIGAGASHFSDVDELLASLERHLPEQPTFLVKGSRFMRMERVVEKLAAN